MTSPPPLVIYTTTSNVVSIGGNLNEVFVWKENHQN